MLNIGILALQGDFEKHGAVIERLGHRPLFVRRAEELRGLVGLILPGGESTTFLHLIEKLQLRQPLIDFAGRWPVFGTCAGLIVLARSNDNLPFPPFGLIDLEVTRNAYGRQINSFIARVELKSQLMTRQIEAVFIRAPKIVSMGREVVPYAWLGEEVVMAGNNRILAATFHPELTSDTTIHQFFIDAYILPAISLSER